VAAPLNPNQLKMFMTPREIGGFVTAYGDFGDNPGGLPHEAMNKLDSHRADEKRSNVEGSGMKASIASGGIRKPLDIAWATATPEPGKPDERFLWNGHHRLQTQSEIDPDTPIPVVHTSMDEGLYHGRDSRGFRAQGLAYKTFGMDGNQIEDPTGVKRR
jgi:hypothetical protein